MLDEDEYKIIYDLYGQAMKATNEYRIKYELPLNNCSINERFKPVCMEYEKMTGFKETNVNAIMHHRISIYGSDCSNCGKPLRTPRANFCAYCGKNKFLC